MSVCVNEMMEEARETGVEQRGSGDIEVNLEEKRENNETKSNLSGIHGGILGAGFQESKKEAARNILRKKGLLAEDLGSDSNQKPPSVVLAEQRRTDQVKILCDKMYESMSYYHGNDRNQVNQGDEGRGLGQGQDKMNNHAHKVEMDVLGLAQLQRRIKDEAQRKAKLRAREKEGAFGYRPVGYDERKETERGSDEGRESDYNLRYNPAQTLSGRDGM